MPLYTFDAIPIWELFPGFDARLIHTPRLTQSYVTITAGAAFPEHHHPHEQTVTVLDGELELTAGAETVRLTPGTMYVIPSGVPHSGRALTACRVLDTFVPGRDDLKRRD
jgi:quercetin dioxygenase-like cupin family protein